MPPEEVRIDELYLRVLGLSVEDARHLAETLAERIAAALPVRGRREHLGALDVRLTVPAGVSRDRLADALARAVIEQLE
jgi:hypothetical protein